MNIEIAYREFRRDPNPKTLALLFVQLARYGKDEELRELVYNNTILSEYNTRYFLERMIKYPAPRNYRGGFPWDTGLRKTVSGKIFNLIKRFYMTYYYVYEAYWRDPEVVRESLERLDSLEFILEYDHYTIAGTLERLSENFIHLARRECDLSILEKEVEEMNRREIFCYILLSLIWGNVYDAGAVDEGDWSLAAKMSETHPPLYLDKFVEISAKLLNMSILELYLTVFWKE